MKVLDLCTEFGSETTAFRDRGHEVITLGIEGDVDIKCDVRHYYPSVDDHYDFIICHPPCQEFSLAMLNPVPCRERHPDLSIVWACQRIIETLSPQYWIMENPRACLRHFIGKPTITIRYSDYGHYTHKPTDLWGCFPWFYSQTPCIHPPLKAWQNGVKDPSLRACLPYGLSLAICKAIERDMEHSASKAL